MVLMACQDPQLSLARFAGECTAAGMRISVPKSEAMVFSRKPVGCAVQVWNEALLQVKEFKYLRVLFMNEGRMESSVSSAPIP